MSNPNSSTDSNGSQRAEQIRQIVKDCLLGRADGQVITDESLIESHPDLMPELADDEIPVVPASQERESFYHRD